VDFCEANSENLPIIVTITTIYTCRYC